jgi:putative transposase
MQEMIDLFRFKDFYYKYQTFKILVEATQNKVTRDLHSSSAKSVDIIAFSFMPTHIHLILKQLEDNGISNYMSRILNSYSRYFNIKHDRSGPLWECRFKNKHIEDDEQLLHTTRYIHLNPTTANLVDKPEDWEFSSYNEFIKPYTRKICNSDVLPDFTPEKYKEFVDDQISYQKDLKNY